MPASGALIGRSSAVGQKAPGLLSRGSQAHFLHPTFLSPLHLLPSSSPSSSTASSAACVLSTTTVHRPPPADPPALAIPDKTDKTSYPTPRSPPAFTCVKRRRRKRNIKQKQGFNLPVKLEQIQIQIDPGTGERDIRVPRVWCDFRRLFQSFSYRLFFSQALSGVYNGQRTTNEERIDERIDR